MVWSHEAEYLASTKIREKSLKRPLGGVCSCCPGCCFHRKWMLMGYIHGGMFLIAGIVIMLIIGGITFKKAADSSKFIPANCTTLSSNITGSLFCKSCDRKNDPECQREYPCLEMTVSLQAGSTQISETFLFEKWQTLFENTKCMVYEKGCGSNAPDFPTDIVMSLQKRYGTPGSTSDCYYNPENPNQVVLKLYSISGGTYLMTGLGVLFILVGVILNLIVYLSCGCEYLWGCRPPLEIQDELRQRQREQMGAQWHQQSPGWSNEGYTQEYSSGFNN